MDAHAVPCAEFIYEDLGVSLIMPKTIEKRETGKPSARVLVLPDWQGGHTQYALRMAALFKSKLRAETLIFNQYPVGVQPKTYLDEGEHLVAALLSDLGRFRKVLRTVLRRAQTHWACKNSPLVLLGFCFGGTAAFEAARVDDTVDVAFSIHGTPVLDPTQSAIAKTRAAMHYIGGGDDKLVPEWTVTVFQEEIDQTNRRGSLTLIPGQGHSFTKKEIGKAGPLSRYSRPALFHTLELTHEVVTQEIKTNFQQKESCNDAIAQ